MFNQRGRGEYHSGGRNLRKLLGRLCPSDLFTEGDVCLSEGAIQSVPPSEPETAETSYSQWNKTMWICLLAIIDKSEVIR